MNIQPLTVGPIVGATTGTIARLWGRGEVELIGQGPRRCFGVARIRPAGGRYGTPKFFKMNPNFDMTGVVIFGGLSPESEYIYQMGWFFSDREPEELGILTLDWEGITSLSFRTAAENAAQPRSFVFGSCRYLLRLLGGSWFDNRGDKTFRSILQQIEDDTQTDHVLMIGDQIYADDLNFIGPDSLLDEYNSRYRDVFTQDYIRQVMSRVPTYMTLDDHEIEDGWPANASAKDWMVKYPAAVHAYQTYQASHSPLFQLAGDRITGRPSRWWYTFQDGCCDFFVTDTRTERFLAEEPEEKEIVSQEQLEALKLWLADGSGRIKFMVSAVPVFPEVKLDNSDKWGGFVRQRDELLDFIRANQIQRVVFLSGDVHTSLSAELVCPESDPGFKIIGLTSSAFYWPYPHSPKRAFRLDGSITSAASGVTYRVTNAGGVHPTDNFTRITADMDGLRVEVFSRKGRRLSSRSFTF